MVPTVPETETPFSTTTPSTPAMTAMTAKQVDSVHVHTLPVQNTSWSGPPAHCAHVHKLLKQLCKPGDSLALKKCPAPTQWKDFCEQTPIRQSKTFCHIIPVALKVYDIFQGNHTNFT